MSYHAHHPDSLREQKGSPITQLGTCCREPQQGVDCVWMDWQLKQWHGLLSCQSLLFGAISEGAQSVKGCCTDFYVITDAGTGAVMWTGEADCGSKSHCFGDTALHLIGLNHAH